MTGTLASNPPPSSAAEAIPPVADIVPAALQVSVVDIDMPFGSMVGFMVKWAIATIPALIVLAIVLTAIIPLAYLIVKVLGFS